MCSRDLSDMGDKSAGSEWWHIKEYTQDPSNAGNPDSWTGTGDPWVAFGFNNLTTANVIIIPNAANKKIITIQYVISAHIFILFYSQAKLQILET